MSQLDRDSDPEIDAVLQAERNERRAGCADVVAALLVMAGALVLYILYVLTHLTDHWL